MELGLQNKVVVVTGGANGIGKAVAEEFAKEGCRIAICDINPDALAATYKEFTDKGYDCFAGQVNVCDVENVNSFALDVYKHFGALNIWLNNAGISKPKPMLELEIGEWEQVIKVNMNSVFIGSQAAAKIMKENGGGVILNTASFAGIMPTAYKASYAASKAGVMAMTKEFASELAPFGIRVAAVAPGMIETDMMAARLTGPEREKILSRIALRKTGKPVDVARLFIYLASDAATFVSGSTYEITGGMFCVQDPMVPWGLY